MLIAGSDAVVSELRAAGEEFEVVGHTRSIRGAEEALRSLRPSVLVLDPELCHREGLCSLPSLRRASPDTAIVLPAGRAPDTRKPRAH